MLSYHRSPDRLQWDIVDTLYSASHTWVAPVCHHNQNAPANTCTAASIRYPLLYSSIHFIKQVLTFVDKEDMTVQFGDPDTYPLTLACIVPNRSVVLKMLVSPKIEDDTE